MATRTLRSCDRCGDEEQVAPQQANVISSIATISFESLGLDSKDLCPNCRVDLIRAINNVVVKL